MKKRISIIHILIICGILASISAGSLWRNVYADVTYGDGTGATDGTFRACNAAHRWQNVRECSARHGGASWHVFSTSNLPIHDENAPNSDDRPILTASLWDGLAGNETARTAKFNAMINGIKSCPSGYYVAMVYDGWYGAGSNWSSKSLFFYGPLAWGEYDQEDDGVHHTPIYHKGGTSYTASQVDAGFNNGTYMNGWRISGEGPTESHLRASQADWRSDEATKLFRLYMGDNSASIPKGTGWFCYAGESYEGKVDATNSNGSFTQSSQSTRYSEVACNTRGCSVSFTHTLRRKNGSSGTTSYTITRDSNLTNNANGKAVSSGTLKSGESGGFTWTDTITMYPGMTVCETLSFKPHPKKNDIANIPVCVMATGDAQPPDPTNIDGPSGDEAFVNIKVKNTYASTTYQNYQRTVYAKPGDKLSWRGTYNPVLQYTAYIEPDQMQINSGTKHNGNGTNLARMFNTYRGSLPTWKNGFSIQTGINSNFTSTISNDNYNAGDTTFRSREMIDATAVGDGDVGKTINGRAISSLNSHNQTTPGQVSFSRNGNRNLGNINTASRQQVANARVPYNYDTSISVERDENEPVFAGDRVTIPIKYDILPRSNSVTMKSGDRDYATIVGNPKYKIIVYRGVKKSGTSSWNGELCSYYGLANNEASCGYSEEASGSGVKEDINSGLDRYNGKRNGKLSRSFYVQDLNAGETVCVAAAFWPANSGAATNMDADGSKSWRISDSKCYVVAKKPSIQIWGGNVYSQSNITTNTSTKYNLSGYTGYSVKQSKGTFVFGSWGELGVVGNGQISGFGSGASMGYGGNGTGWLTPDPFSENNTASSAPNPGGSRTSKYCDLVPLTIPNSNCGDNVAGNLNTAVGTTNAASDKQSIIDLLASGEDTANHTHHNGDATITKGASIDGSTTKVISAEGNITISENLDYFEGGTYTKYNQMPKLIIYSKNNIYINCNVTRIDALLIADDTVVTCDNFGNSLSMSNVEEHINDPQNSIQLIVNGAIIAKRLIPNRTYGAATGVNSIIPAEIINFDPTLYQFGGSAEADDDTTGRLDVTYMHEVAPRL